MMTTQERESALSKMESTISEFYLQAALIGVHPFIEFAGLMAAYVKSCQSAHDAGIDFTECSAHSGVELPIEAFELTYMAEKLECIFGGRIFTTEGAKSAEIRHV